MNIAINGFGRIGRATFKSLIKKNQINIIAINDLTDIKTLAHLLKYDSCYGKYDQDIKVAKNNLIINNKKYEVLAERNPENLPWKEKNIDLVLECTGIFRTREKAELHIKAGAKKVIISAPGKSDNIKTIVLGVNENKVKKTDKVLSMASCTTNSLAPVTNVINKKFGISNALMTTIHSYTADQRLVDGPHKDLRRARTAGVNIIPTTTGAAIATTKTIPELKNSFDGMAIRVPTPVGSICDITFLLKRKVEAEDINKELIKASKTKRLKGILETTTENLVLSDFVGNSASSIVDLSLTKVIGGKLAKVVAWYDNEWGYSNRLADFIEYIKNKKLI